MEQFAQVMSFRVSEYIPYHCKEFSKYVYNKGWDGYASSNNSNQKFLNFGKICLLDGIHVSLKRDLNLLRDEICFINAKYINFGGYSVKAKSVFIRNDFQELGSVDAPEIIFDSFASKSDVNIDHLWVPNTFNLDNLTSLIGKGVKKLYVYNPQTFNPTLNEITRIQNMKEDLLSLREQKMLTVYDLSSESYYHGTEEYCAPYKINSMVKEIDKATAELEQSNSAEYSVDWFWVLKVVVEITVEFFKLWNNAEQERLLQEARENRYERYKHSDAYSNDKEEKKSSKSSGEGSAEEPSVIRNEVNVVIFGANTPLPSAPPEEEYSAMVQPYMPPQNPNYAPEETFAGVPPYNPYQNEYGDIDPYAFDPTIPSAPL